MTEDLSQEQDMEDSTKVEKLSLIRKRTGKHMVGSKATSPHVLAAMEVDYEAVNVARRAHGSAWKASEGSSLTYLPFLVRALAGAIAEYPKVNSSVGEGELVIHRDVNLAVAVDLDFEGLVVPVVHKVSDLSLTDTARALAEIARRARARELVPHSRSSTNHRWQSFLPMGCRENLPLYWMTRAKKLWQYGPLGYSVWPGITVPSTARTPQLSSIGSEN